MKQKTKATVLVLMASTLLSLTSCSQQQPSPTNSGEIESLKTQLESLKTENDDLKAQLKTLTETTTEETTTTQQGIAINVGDTITTDTIELTIQKVELTYDVLPDDTSGFYTHYAADVGNVYLHIDADIKNLAKQNLSCDAIASVTADYNNCLLYTSPSPRDCS